MEVLEMVLVAVSVPIQGERMFKPGGHGSKKYEKLSAMTSHESTCQGQTHQRIHRSWRSRHVNALAVLRFVLVESEGSEVEKYTQGP